MARSSRFLVRRNRLRSVLSRALIAGLFLTTFSFAPGVILFSTGDPTQNTTPPSGLLTNSGWQFEGSFGSFLGTPIGPHHFITVQHIGIASNTFVYRGANYTVVRSFDDTQSDLRIFEVAETFPAYAPLYSRLDEEGRDIVVFGRGTQRGDPVLVGGIIRGWSWGTGDGVQRWGESQVDKLVGVYFYCGFHQNAGPNEAALSSGDSGGAAFTNDNGTWKLIGIHYGVDGPFANNPGDPTFNAALFDVRGLFDSSHGYVVGGSVPVPSGFYSIRIAERLAWIVSIVPAATPAATPTPTPTPTTTPNPTPAPTAGPSLAQMVSPAPGSTLSGPQVTFSWSAGSATYYKLWIGTGSGLSNIYNSGKTSARSVTLGNLPTNGAKVYVRLSTLIGSVWKSNSYTYITYSVAASSSPTPTPSPTPAGRPHGGGGGGGGQ